MSGRSHRVLGITSIFWEINVSCSRIQHGDPSQFKLVEDALTSPNTTEKPTSSMPLLVEKDVDHKFDNGEVYRAHVISVVPGYTSWYNIKYVQDPAIYTYQLREDYLAGNLKIVVQSLRYQC